ncbi:MAG TPA: monovalent cation/H(+) antiporter subunit G [Burkholderiales bacterium]|nr:monovalent cation/H(+) antiporter subunit G [Burkholderiales bacterium]
MTEIVVSLLVLAGAALAFLGSLGLLTLKTFYERVHPPTMGTTLGTGLVLIGSIVFFTVEASRPVLHEVLIGAFMTIGTPVTYTLLVRAALHRDRLEGRDPAGFERRGASEDRTSTEPKQN